MKHVWTRILCLALFLSASGCSDYIGIELLRPGWLTSSAIDINNSGVVICPEGGVGKYWSFIYRDGIYTKLQPPSGWITAYAAAINDNGVVVGWGIDGQKQKGFIATPVTTPK